MIAVRYWRREGAQANGSWERVVCPGCRTENWRSVVKLLGGVVLAKDTIRCTNCGLELLPGEPRGAQPRQLCCCGVPLPEDPGPGEHYDCHCGEKWLGVR